MITDTVSPRVVVLPSMRSAVYCQDSGNVALHAHAEMELVLVIRGAMQIQVGPVCLKGKPGALFILPAHQAHTQKCRGSWRSLCLLFSDFGEIIDKTPRILDCSREPEIRSWLAELSTLYSSNAPIPKIVCHGLLLALLNYISYLEDHFKSIEALPPRLSAAVRYLQANVSKEVSAGSLVRAAGVGYSRLGGLFREHFGCAPLKYHQNLRMNLAKKLLLNPYASIDEIAAQAGFADTNYFCRLFRKIHGVPPGKWRKGVTGTSLQPEIVPRGPGGPSAA